jgi:hypothetical protein
MAMKMLSPLAAPRVGLQMTGEPESEGEEEAGGAGPGPSGVGAPRWGHEGFEQQQGGRGREAPNGAAAAAAGAGAGAGGRTGRAPQVRQPVKRHRLMAEQGASGCWVLASPREWLSTARVGLRVYGSLTHCNPCRA